MAKQAKRCECVARSRFGRAVGEVNPANGEAVKIHKICNLKKTPYGVTRLLRSLTLTRNDRLFANLHCGYFTIGDCSARSLLAMTSARSLLAMSMEKFYNFWWARYPPYDTFVF